MGDQLTFSQLKSAGAGQADARSRLISTREQSGCMKSASFGFLSNVTAERNLVGSQKGNGPGERTGAASPLAVTLRGGEFGGSLHLLGDRVVAAASFGQSNSMRMP
jgi:hypothetical protein